MHPLLLTLPLVLAGDPKADLKQMEGTWKIIIVEMDGKPVSDKEKGLPLRLVVKSGKFTTSYRDKVLTQGSLRLNPGKESREIDADLEIAPFKGMVQKGLYEIKADEMRVIFAEPGMERPINFTTRKGEILIHYTRLKDGKK